MMWEGSLHGNQFLSEKDHAKILVLLYQMIGNKLREKKAEK
jgi:hypothetical protein